MKISVVINTYNAEAYLESVLKTLKDYDEILICDMYSTDRTIEIAEKYNCHIIYHEHVGYADPARQYAIMQAEYDWILMVDADECIPPGLKDYIIKTVENNPDLGAIRFPVRDYFMGRFMHGVYPNYSTRFFRRGKVFWSGEIHTKPEITGETFLVPRKLTEMAFIHNGTPSIEYVINKTNNYSNIEVRRRLKKSHGWFDLTFGPFARFFKAYIIRKGFKDGIPGLISAVNAANYKFYAIAKTIESKIKIDDYDHEFLSYFGDDLRRIETKKSKDKEA